ncbi:pseudouridine-5'-phosphate glycosidase [Seinonella peptonophila]|uniref:Pseudouridine-5'-phosphate glycosidase n=1 Tax=Seinonella peptonophila TaxID=112248 RepID=A0A1M4ZPI1_9BACL|nr:pseudouridine-5'-phosphate glycosidase [Seinonella peptonophila]SHF20020.1 pseudouridine-5'-phosphate glycosidase [Seinonella peptonophila]
MNPYLSFSEEVQQAFQQRLPVVALETTIISFGFPYPYNLQTALEMEAIIRQHGAVPATIGLIEGKVKIGLDKEEIELFATKEQIIKVSRRDFAYALSQKKLGATTISGTMIAAHLAGIRVFATGGLGGVHRGSHLHGDVSNDLEEISRNQVAVISSGAKAILDLPLTLEYLETTGVPVVGYQSNDFASFYSRTSGLPSNFRLDSPAEVAKLMHTQWDLGFSSGLLVANPVPKSEEIPFQEIDHLIQQAVAEAESQKITGKEVTPFLLKRINQLSDGKSLLTNLALVRENAKVGAQIAVAYHQLNRD